MYTVNAAEALLMVRIAAIEIDDHVLDKIESKHGVQWEEVEQACSSPALHLRRGRDGLYQAFARTDAGRYLFIVLADNREWHVEGSDREGHDRPRARSV